MTMSTETWTCVGADCKTTVTDQNGCGPDNELCEKCRKAYRDSGEIIKCSACGLDIWKSDAHGDGDERYCDRCWERIEEARIDVALQEKQYREHATETGEAYDRK